MPNKKAPSWPTPNAGQRPDQVLAAAEAQLEAQKAYEKYAQQRIDLNSRVDSLKNQIASTKDIISSLEKNRSAAAQALSQIKNSYPPPSATTLANAIAAYNKADTAVKAYQQKLKDLQAALKTAESQLKQVDAAKKYVDFSKKPDVQGKGNGNSKPDKNPKKPAAPVYKFNAPMVKSAYTRGLQAQTARFDKVIKDAGKMQGNAADYWKTNAGAKGAIQMSRHFADLAPKSVDSNSPVGRSSQIFDPQMYGFKFLYNPEKVSMAWGIVEQFSPQFEAYGSDRNAMISVGLMKSAIQFQLVLNRIGDMQWINEFGTKQEVTSTDIYPRSIDSTELSEIYKRGTMYDLEYLFKASGGYSAQYHSTLNGITADKGWLQPIPVELHLGEGLRYLVRISTLDVKHAIFDERMVPILTFVDITCTRYFDGPEMFPTDDKTIGAQKKDVFEAASTDPNKVLK